jgi:hypothetical protein
VASNPYGDAASYPPAILTVLSGRPVIDSFGFASNRFRLRFQTESNLTYQVQYKTDLNDSSWNLLVATNGSGGQVTIEDPAPSLPGRFYRLLVQ